MKSKILARLRQPATIRSSDLFWIVFAGSIWMVLTHARPVLMDLRCKEVPTPCTPESVFFLDRIALGIQDLKYMVLSDWTQAFAGVLGFGIPLAWAFTRRAKLIEIIIDLNLVLQSTLMNGLMTEIFRIAIQRPRPFVYDNPAEHGPDPAHYTSFYSGHTSFTATAVTAMVLILYSRGAPKLYFRILCVLGYSMVVLTALFRVLSERHFPTDVIAGGLAGFFVALVVAHSHREENPSGFVRTYP